MPVALGVRVLTEEPVATGVRVPDAEPDTVALAMEVALGVAQGEEELDDVRVAREEAEVEEVEEVKEVKEVDTEAVADMSGDAEKDTEDVPLAVKDSVASVV